MKKVWIFLTISCLILSTNTLLAGGINIFQSDKEENLDEMTNAEIMASVDLGKYAPMIQKFQYNEALNLRNGKYNKNSGCNVETLRNREIIIVTIPTDYLFLPNETTLLKSGDKYLDPIKRYLKIPDMYRVILVVHTDNTGSDTYTDNLALDRVDAIFEWFENNVADTKYIFPTASGATEPLVPNISGENRSKNRRLEIYLVPGNQMLESAKKGRIAL